MNNVDEMISVVEAFIYDKTGKKVKIVFNDPFNVQRHLEMLKWAYNYIKEQK